MIRELLSAETGLAFAMQALRGDIADERAFVQQVEEIQRPEGYLYVDDLSTLPDSRQRGHAPAWSSPPTIFARYAR